MNAKPFKWRNFKSSAVSGLCFLCAVMVITPLALVLFHIIRMGASSVDWNFLTHLPKPVGEPGGGMANAIVGSFILIGLAVVIGVPVGVLGGVYLSEYGSDRLNWSVRFAADILNGTPSIVWGIVVYALVVVPMKSFSAWAGGLALGFMMIPMVIRTTEEMLALVPGGLREGALALGISKWKSIVSHCSHHRPQRNHHRRAAGLRASRRGNSPAALYGFRQPVLEFQPFRADFRLAAPDL